MSKAQTMVRTLLALGAAGMVVASATACDVNINSQKAGSTSSPGAPATGQAAPAKNKTAYGSKPVAGKPTGAPAAEATPACQNRQMKIAFDRSTSGLGTTVDRYTYTNKGTFTCDLYGHPGLRLFAPGNVEIKTVKVGRISTGGQDEIYAAATHVHVPAGGTAAFSVRYNLTPVYDDATGKPLPCPSVSEYGVTVPPSDEWSDYLQVPLAEPHAFCSGVDISSIVANG